MIELLIYHGSALFWALLFLGIYFTTVFADRRTSLIPPMLWAGLTLLFVFGFTDVRIDPGLAAILAVAHIMCGGSYAVIRWIQLVGEIRIFTHSVKPVSDDWMLRHLIQKEFGPNDACDNVITLPPDPYEFRTRILLWFFFWPCFLIFRPVARVHKKTFGWLWDKFHNMSIRIYEG